MKFYLLGGVLMSLAVGLAAQPPQTQVQVVRPETGAGVVRPQTDVSVNRPITQTSAQPPYTTVTGQHPVRVEPVTYPVTSVEVTRPVTEVEVIHPQTMLEGGTSNVGTTAQKKGVASSSQKTTSMSDFQPKQAKDFTKNEKAASLGGGTLNLGNATANQAEKDNVNKNSLLGAQNNQNITVDPKQNNLGGLEKLVTDRSKWKEKQK